MSDHNLLVVSGPSGTGKSTLIHMFLAKHKEISFSVSYTTRPKRKNELEGKDYYFVSEKEFFAMVKKEKFVEWANVHLHHYGTGWEEIQSKSKGEKTLVLDVDVQGAKKIREKFPQAWLIFVVPPSLSELKKRLLGRERGQESSNIIKRLQQAEVELAQYNMYDFIIKNDQKEKACEILNNIYLAHRSRKLWNEGLIESMIGSKK